MYTLIHDFWQFIGNNAAEIIALCALVFTAYQLSVTRKHNKLMVKPHLCLSTNTYADDDGFEFEALIKNNGIGPAVIKKYKLFLDKKELSNTELDSLESIVRNQLQRAVTGFGFIKLNVDYVISEKGEELFLNFTVPTNLNTSLEELKKSIDKFDVYIEYQSIYGQTYTFDSQLQRDKN